MENLLNKVIDIPPKSNGHMNGNGLYKTNMVLNGNGYHAVNRNGHEHAHLSDLISADHSDKKEIEMNYNEFVSPMKVNLDDFDIRSVNEFDFKVSEDGSAVNFIKKKTLENDVANKATSFRYRSAKFLYYFPSIAGKYLGKLVESIISHIVLFPFSVASIFVGGKNFFRSETQEQGILRNAEDVNQILIEFENLKRNIELNRISEEEFYKIITQWAADWTGLGRVFLWTYDPETSTMSYELKRDNRKIEKDPILDLNDKLVIASKRFKLRLTKERYLEKKMSGKNNYGAMWRTLYEGIPHYVRDIENTPKTIPFSGFEKFLSCYFTIRSGLYMPISYDKQKGYSKKLLAIMDDKQISDNKDLFIKAYILKGITDLAAAMQKLIEFDRNVILDRNELEQQVKSLEMELEKANQIKDEHKISEISFELKHYVEILANKDQIDFLNRTSLLNKINYELVQLMVKKIYEKNHEKNQVIDEKKVIEMQKEIIQKFQKRINESNAAQFGKEIAKEIMEQSIMAEKVDVPFRNINRILQFIDLKHSTSYAEMLKNPLLFGLLIKAFHSGINSSTLEHDGQLINSQGDGAFHAYSDEKKSILSFIQSRKNLEHTSNLLNYELFENINDDFLSKEGVYSKKLMDYLSMIYENRINFTKYDLEIAEIDRLLMNKNSSEIKSLENILYPIVKNLSVKIFNDLSKENGFKYKVLSPLFDYKLEVRMGIHYGVVTMGSIGTGSKIDITALGDSVNTTSRVESSNKTFGTNMLVTEQFLMKLLKTKSIKKQIGKIKITTKDGVESLFYREIDNVLFVGKEVPIKIFELIN